MKITKMVVSYGVKRSASYQTADVSMSMEIEVKTGETPDGVFEQAMQTMAPLVEKEADAALRDLVRIAS